MAIFLKIEFVVLFLLRITCFQPRAFLESIQEATKNGVDKSEGSIRMKFGNIATLCDVYGITVLTKMGRLSKLLKTKSYRI